MLQGVDRQTLAIMAGYVAPRALEPEVADMCTEEVMAAALLAGVPRERAIFTSRPRDTKDVVNYCAVHKVCTLHNSDMKAHSVPVIHQQQHQ